METKRLIEKDPKLNKDDLIVVTGAGGFIGGALTREFHEQGLHPNSRRGQETGPEWYQRVPGWNA